MTVITCTVDHASMQRSKGLAETGWADLLSEEASGAMRAVEAAIEVIRHGGDLARTDREIIEDMIQRDNVVGGSGFVADDLTELLALVERRRQGVAITPPPCLEEQLLAVACPVCTATVGANCHRRPGEVLSLPQHHAERFWEASGGYSRPPALVPRVPEDALWIPAPGEQSA
jgi:hypothetical protein